MLPLHILVGLARLAIAYPLTDIYRWRPSKWLGRRIVRLCCDASWAGAGVDEGAISVMQRLGPDLLPLLEQEIQSQAAKGSVDVRMQVYLQFLKDPKQFR